MHIRPGVLEGVEVTDCPVCGNPQAMVDIVPVRLNGPCYVALCGPCGATYILGTVGPADRSPDLQVRYMKALKISMQEGA